VHSRPLVSEENTKAAQGNRYAARSIFSISRNDFRTKRGGGPRARARKLDIFHSRYKCSTSRLIPTFAACENLHFTGESGNRIKQISKYTFIYPASAPALVRALRLFALSFDLGMPPCRCTSARNLSLEISENVAPVSPPSACVPDQKRPNEDYLTNDFLGGGRGSEERGITARCLFEARSLGRRAQSRSSRRKTRRRRDSAVSLEFLMINIRI